MDLHGDALEQLFLVLNLLEDVISNLLGSGWCLTFTLFRKLSHILVWVQVVLVLKGTIGLDVLAKRHDSSLQVDDQVLLEGFPEPGVLIEELGLVIGIGREGLLGRDDWGLDSLRILCLEELLEKERLQVGDLLDALHTLLKDILDLGNNV